jgi:hypothetical protein
MRVSNPFRQQLREDLEIYLARQQQRFPADEVLRIDLHCHDKNSDVPDELIGRIMRLPETWIPTDRVVEALRQRGTDALTITNHNNARSCWDLLDRGHDILVGSEITCTVPEYGVHLHVLTYGFDPKQEQRLLRLRNNLYRFLDYTRQEDLPTILAHPLYFYFGSKVPPIELLEKLTVAFDNFEALNGQRDSWQNLLVATWIESLTPERIDELGRKVGIRPDAFCRRPYENASAAAPTATWRCLSARRARWSTYPS